ncbi:YraN family protein [Flavobacterium sp. I3-2]|uniref:YraN family protein n=1 Tax=Flavobacterium sp. I3-2 TaxID=2748319 RepID=UPI0015B0EF1E|nr:YraN family protein [Flavobacterium sp. I3-2]
MAEHNDLGQLGEDLAVSFLEEKQYQILERNYRFQKAEIDIIAQIEDVLVVVEVKTRTSVAFGLPQDFIKPAKIKLLVKAINQYIVDKDLNLNVRFDIVAIHKNTKGIFDIEHIEDAFYHF